MSKEAMAKKSESGKIHTIHHAVTKNGSDLFESYLPAGSRQRAVAGITTAAVGALLAAALLGVGPAALAGAAGYVVYHEAHRK